MVVLPGLRCQHGAVDLRRNAPGALPGTEPVGRQRDADPAGGNHRALWRVGHSSRPGSVPDRETTGGRADTFGTRTIAAPPFRPCLDADAAGNGGASAYGGRGAAGGGRLHWHGQVVPEGRVVDRFRGRIGGCRRAAVRTAGNPSVRIHGSGVAQHCAAEEPLLLPCGLVPARLVSDRVFVRPIGCGLQVSQSRGGYSYPSCNPAGIGMCGGLVPG